MNRHPVVAKLLILINFALDVSQPLALVHKASIAVRVFKRLRKQQTESAHIMLDFGLVPGVLKRQNPPGFITGQPSILGTDCQTHRLTYAADQAVRRDY